MIHSSYFPFGVSGQLPTGFLSAFAVDVPTPGTMVGIGYYGTAAGDGIKVGLYSDANGAPGSLIVEAFAGTTTAGSVVLPVQATPLLPGVYWIAYESAGTSFLGFDGNLTVPVTLEVINAVAFSDPLPPTFVPNQPPFQTATFNFWIQVAP